MELFYENLRKYQPFEVTASQLICKLNNVTVDHFNNNNQYDFKTSDEISYEVKCEPSSLKTGNYFVEIFAYGKPSGISVTQAHYYIFCDETNYYQIAVDELKTLVKYHGILKKTRDGSTAGHLVKCTIINEASTKLNYFLKPYRIYLF